MRQDNNHNFMANKLIEKNPISKKKEKETESKQKRREKGRVSEIFS